MAMPSNTSPPGELMCNWISLTSSGSSSSTCGELAGGDSPVAAEHASMMS
jgi:hypothetical protein